MIVLLNAHPYPLRSRANRTLFDQVSSLEGVNARVLYDLYPDFSIDVEAEQAALLNAHTIVWQHPMYWYGPPALLTLWFEKVLAHGWAYGGGTALAGKRVQWVVTTGGDDSAFQPEGMHGHTFDKFVPPMEQTARFCGMSWEPPLVIHGAHKVSTRSLRESAQTYKRRIETLLAKPPELTTTASMHQLEASNG